MFLVVVVLSGRMNAGDSSQVITIKADNMRFDLSTITVKAGQPVTIRFENNDMMDHIFAIEALDVWSEQISPREVTEVTFTPQQAGDYVFSCPFPGHTQQGMVGTLHVVD